MKRTIKQPIKKGAAKVPVVMQLEALECGAACLTMILAYYGKWIPLEQVRLDCGVSRDGSKAVNLLKAARRYGLKAAGYRYEPEQLKEKGSFPCIVHWNFNHFVVLNGFKGNRVFLNDPAKGNCVVSMEDFDEAFTGVCLFFEPGDEFVPEGKRKSMISFAAARLKGAESAFVFVALTAMLTSILEMIQPAFTRVFLDRLLTDTNSEWTSPFFMLLVFLCLLQIVSLFLTEGAKWRINGKLASYGSASYFWKVLRLPMEFFSQRMAGDIQQRQTTNSEIANTLVNTFAPLLFDAAMMLFYLVVMFRYSVILSAVGLAAVITNLLIGQLISSKRINITRVQMRDKGKLEGTTVSGIEMIETIKVSGVESGFFAKWAGFQASVNNQETKYTLVDQYLGMLPNIISDLAGIIVLSGGVYLTMQGNFTLGMVLAFQGFLTSFSEPAATLISAGQGLQEMRTEMERVEDVMSYPLDSNCRDEDDLKGDEEFGKLKGHVELRNVTFGYSRLEPPLIENFNLDLKPGERVAFVGGSGCGKSTLAKLISGLYKPWSGEILFDGKPIDEIRRSVFTGSVAVVDQDIILFEDTIANNIKMWDNSIADFEMILAARDARLHEDIMQRDGGYQYKLTEGGKDLSGGQRQRMEIARVLAQDPTIIILDEATSALDAKTEHEVVQSIRDRGISCIVVAHRLSTVRDCDEILVMEHGKVVERGTHDELYAQNGVYTALVSVE
ncbi:MAG: NHLP family bacteriocin export ABC transporter peptidase/permease/ATPase subunit [Clostridia bacterium]|nr:NHLP family bacteriocin export ABC transporter peptidase/permease/ATPase subunit [Clostridia bacterium]